MSSFLLTKTKYHKSSYKRYKKNSNFFFFFFIKNNGYEKTKNKGRGNPIFPLWWGLIYKKVLGTKFAGLEKSLKMKTTKPNYFVGFFLEGSAIASKAPSQLPYWRLCL